MNENPTIEELREGVRTGRSFHPFTPGLKEVARDLIRPIVEGMRGKEIIYRCRAPWLLRVTSPASAALNRNQVFDSTESDR